MRKQMIVVAAMAFAAVGGTGTGAAATAAPPMSYQCYSINGGSGCDFCSGPCLGGQYLCCGSDVEVE